MTISTVEVIKNGASSELSRHDTVDAKTISKWLIDKNIIFPTEQLVAYIEIGPWKRAGGETFIADFQIATDQATKHIVVKALATLFPEKTLRDWERRRHILAESGIPVSNWYWFGDGIIFEDYYEFTAYGKVDFHKLLEIAFKLDHLGFETFNFLDDLRADPYGNPYFVDFGFDLGEPSSVPSLRSKITLCKVFPNKLQRIESFYKQR